MHIKPGGNITAGKSFLMAFLQLNTWPFQFRAPPDECENFSDSDAHPSNHPPTRAHLSAFLRISTLLNKHFAAKELMQSRCPLNEFALFCSSVYTFKLDSRRRHCCWYLKAARAAITSPETHTRSRSLCVCFNWGWCYLAGSF